MKKNQLYHGFKVVDVVALDECHSTGIQLVHEKTGLEVFHLLNDDEENLFAFAFGTPPKDSTGAAHVLEHSVLCGSQKFPVKDPFIRLANQSVKTYLNAYTTCDKTVFPASSTVKADYFNLMAVYGDAVFFPRLLPEIFLQEAHRVELDDEGNASIQGVVYNEMKGAYSSFDNVASDACDRAMLGGTYYMHDSGGDPTVIPTLTHKALKAFHKKYYCPANCFIFLYGNIPTEEQLDFLNKNIVSRFTDAGVKASFPRGRHDAIKQFVHEYGPAGDGAGQNKSTVLLNWKTSLMEKDGTPSFERSIVNLFLAELLWGEDNAPVARALIKSGLGQDIAPQSGCRTEIRENFLTCGLRGVAAENAKKVERVINETLLDLCRNGIHEDDVKRSILAFDFSNREVKRINGPYSLMYLRRCIKGWQYDRSPWAYLCVNSQFNVMRKKIEEDPEYLVSLIKKLLVQNKNHSLVVVTPSIKWNEKRAAQEKKLINSQRKKEGDEKIRSDMEALHVFQQKKEDQQTSTCIPHLRISDLTIKDENILTDINEVCGIPYFVNKQDTNGILYASIAFPADVCAPADYPFIAAMAPVLTGMGWGDLSWEQSMQLIGKTMGSFSAYANTSSVPVKNVKLKKWQGRDWIIFYFKTLVENVKESFDVAADCIANVSFKDCKRLKNLIDEQCNDGSASVVQSAHYFAALRASCLMDRASAVAESWYGISGLFTNKTLSKMTMKAVSSRFERIYGEMKNGGAIIHLTADDEGIKAVKKILPSFIEKAGLKPLEKKRPSKDSEFFALTAIPRSAIVSQTAGPGKINELFMIPGTVGFASSVVRSAWYDTEESIEDAVFTRCLENTTLWEQIRTVGGAYGVFFQTNSECASSTFSTYRDPKPFNSLDVFTRLLGGAKTVDFSGELVEKTVTGCYSAEIQPKTPATKGGTGFLWELYCYSNEQQKRRIKWLISITPKKLHAAALRYARQARNQRTVVICGRQLVSGKIKESTGKIIKLPVY